MTPAQDVLCNSNHGKALSVWARTDADRLKAFADKLIAVSGAATRSSKASVRSGWLVKP